MFKIIPQNDENIICSYLDLCGAKRYDGAFVYAMLDYDSNDLMAISQFEIGSNEAYIYDIKAVRGLNDFEAMFILIRQTMNFIEKCGVEKCYAKPESGDEVLITSAGFKPQEDGLYSVKLTGMFDGNCQGHKKT